MPRPGTERAEEILKEVAHEHKIASWMLKRRDMRRQPRVAEAKQAFVERARAAGIMSGTIADLLGLHHTSVSALSSPARRATKAVHAQRRRAAQENAHADVSPNAG